MEDISPENLDALDKRYRATAKTVAAQIVFSVILIVAVWLFAPRTENTIEQQTRTTLWVVIIFLALGAFILRRLYYRWDRLKDVALLKGTSGLLANLQKNAVILSLFPTLLTVVGCVITILSGENFEMLRAGIVALIVFLINFPRRSVWKKIVAGLEKV